MKYEKRMHEIQDALDEARRFIEKAEKVRMKMFNEKFDGDSDRDHASMKRASMELSHALVKLRKPLWNSIHAGR